MKWLIVLFFSVVFCQSVVDHVVIDDFSVGSNSAVVVIPSSSSFPIIQSSIYTLSGTSSRLLGGARDMILNVTSGSANRIVSSSVNNNQWTVGTPTDASATVTLQWDGKDNSTDLSVNGLGAVDLTDLGTASRFHLIAESDLATSVTVVVYSQNQECVSEFAMSGSSGLTDFYVEFSSFSGNCNFSAVGAIELSAKAASDVDARFTFFATASGSNSPGSKTPSNTPVAIVSKTPSRTPSRDPNTSTSSSDSRRFPSFRSNQDDDDSSDACVRVALSFFVVIILLLV